MKNWRQWFWVILIMSLSGFVGCSSTPPIPTSPPIRSLPNGEEIIKKSREHLKLIQDEKSRIILKLIAKNSATQEIIMSRYWKNYNNRDGVASKSILFTEAPPSLYRQNFMIWDYSVKGKPQDLWMYLPSLLNILRVSPRQQGDAFMGSDLTFADMGQRRLDEDIHNTIGREIFRGVACFIVESIPKGKEGVYGKTVTWVSEDHYTTQKIDYYDPKGAFLKQQTIDWEVLKDMGTDTYFWKKVVVVNEQTAHKTVLEINNRKVNIGLSEDDFTERALSAGHLQK